MRQKLVQKGRTPMVLQIRLRRTWLLALYLVSLIVFSSMVTAKDLPPIECPLRKAGTHTEPKAQVETTFGGCPLRKLCSRNLLLKGELV